MIKSIFIATDTYDAVTGFGVLLPNHINDDAFEEMIRITKPGTMFCTVCLSG